jgi:pimeloyl-ACP methyl ester carboxylesterase
MSSTRVETVSVPGARLHCEISGSGPLLLLIAGAAADAGALTGLVTRLSGKYTVLTYDMRGLSRSPQDGPAQDLGIEVLGDDAHRILAAFSSEPALVLGCSGGALVGLELAARHPEQVSVLIAHEPPVIALLPNGQQSKMTPQAREFLMRSHANMSHLFAHQIRDAASYRPDIDTLSRVPSRIVIAAGAASHGQAPHEAAVQLADRLGVEIAELPGDHQGFAAQPTEFAAAVDRLLSEGPGSPSR